MSSTVPSQRKGITHLFTPRLTAFEHTPKASDSEPQNIIIFIAGLSDGLLTVPYPTSISDALPADWSLAQVLLSSAYTGWGLSSLKKDAEELSKCVAYFRTIKSGKIILMGHSTGSQDVMEYLTGPGHETNAPIDGGIIQAPASDREALGLEMNADVLKSGISLAQKMVDTGDGEEILPYSASHGFFQSPVCARRFLSLASPNHDGDDDYFSSDLTDDQLKKTFGSLPARSPLCILVSENDEFVPKSVDKEALVKRWIDIVKNGGGRVDEDNSAVIPGASHSLSKTPEAVPELVKRVLGFLKGLSSQPSL
ncbi:hypothetical protein DSL72_003601 [Monilinia vaccinii-corymbosi]|uniref:AB hydrolase-1 domain-containing protein n=1 Tax=Monilinia vaccinii-corymbosi TaxID=61207 RepID=A0A8A3P2S5_9HELO|nr:hypothetical protein DSL72_003601 [Monilinia vaccinii-corymbosi]